MRLPISDTYSGIIQNTLSRTGSIILFGMLKEAAEKAEALFDKDQVPESLRVDATYSHVVATKDYSYCFTLQREQNGLWALTAFEQEETPKPQMAIPC